MLQTIAIGNVGAEPKFNNKDGKEFITFRVAHNDSWTDQAGNQHTSTIWVDCIMAGKPKVAEYLKPGTMVFVMGNVSLRVYSSEKERCMKAGMTINVSRIELLGGSSDDVPTRLYDKDGVQHNVSKYYLTDVKSTTLMNQRGRRYVVNEGGWVAPEDIMTNTAADGSPIGNNNEPDRSSDDAPAFGVNPDETAK